MDGKTAAMRMQQGIEGELVRPKWFVVVCHSGREREAKAQLVNQGFETYLPMRLGHPKSKRPISPFFPRYLFVQFDPTITRWLCICSSIGVHDIIRRGDGFPQAMPDEWIKKIKAWEVEGVIHLMERIKAANTPFKKGDKVHIVDGHFAGIDALVHIAHDSDRVTVLLSLVSGAESLKVKLKSGALTGAALR